MSRIRMALLGNCQVQTYQVLLPAMVDAPLDLVVLDISEAASRDPAVQRAFLAEAATCDVILTQRTNFDLINDEQLRATLPGRLLTIGNFYFRGLQPDSCYVGDFEHRFDRPSPVHSVVILDAFRRGFDIQQAMARFTTDTFVEMGLFDAWQSSLDEMAAREADGGVDVPCLSLMREACRQVPAFLTMNHPSIALLAAYLERVLAAAEIPYKPVNPAFLTDPLAAHDRWPVQDVVAGYFDLPYRTAQAWTINAMGRRFLDLEERVAAFYQAYAEADPAILVVHSPRDLRTALLARPAYAYLAEGGAPPTASNGEPLIAAPDRLASPARPLAPLVRSVVAEELAPIRQALDEVRTYIHKVHSYLEVSDPKIERLSAALTEAEAEAARKAADLGKRGRLFGRAR